MIEETAEPKPKKPYTKPELKTTGGFNKVILQTNCTTCAIDQFEETFD